MRENRVYVGYVCGPSVEKCCLGVGVVCVEIFEYQQDIRTSPVGNVCVPPSLASCCQSFVSRWLLRGGLGGISRSMPLLASGTYALNKIRTARRRGRMRKFPSIGRCVGNVCANQDSAGADGTLDSPGRSLIPCPSVSSWMLGAAFLKAQRTISICLRNSRLNSCRPCRVLA